MEEATRKANFCFEQNRKKESLANWKAKKNNNQLESKKKDFVTNRNFKNNKAKNYSNNNNFQGNRNSTPNNQNNSKSLRKLQIIMETLPRTLNVKSMSSAGSVMAHIMLQSVQTVRRLLAIFILYRRR